MPIHEEPVVGAFYEDEEGKTFEVTSFDENVGTIGIQHSDGTPDEIDLDDWYGMELEQVESDDPAEDDEEEAVVKDDADDDDDDEEDIDEDIDEEE